MKNYIAEVTEKDIVKFLKRNGFILAYLFDRDGNPLPPIERDENGIFVRCTSNDPTTLRLFDEYVKIFKKHMKTENDLDTLSFLKGSYLNMSTFPLFLTSFEANLVTFSLDDESDKMTRKWLAFMYEKFGNEYIADLGEYYHSLGNDNSAEK